MQTLGHYQLTGEIARGGMGVVYRGFDPTLQRAVAIKLLLERARGDPGRRERAMREARALAKLKHPNVVAVHETGVHDGYTYMVMDLVEGETLQERLCRGELPEGEAAEIVMKMASALAHAHSQGILHRDVKPDNVILRGDEPLLTDFGLAKDLEASLTKLSETGSLIGTPGFWPPEQARGQLDRIGPRSDVYGAGALLYALLTREPPIKGATLFEITVATAERPPTPPSALRPGLSAGLEAICLKCLEKEPDDRYESADALALDLDRFLNCRRPMALGLRREAGVAWLVGLGVAGALVVGLTLGLLLGRGAPEGAGQTPVASASGAETDAEGGPGARPPSPGTDSGGEAAPDAETDAGPDPEATQPPRSTEPFVPDRSDRVQPKLPDPVPAEVVAPPATGASVSAERRQQALKIAKSGRSMLLFRAWGGAKDAFDKALEVDPDCVPALVGRATLYRKDHEDSLALKFFQRAIDLSPNDAEAHFELARTVSENGSDLPRALTHFDRALELQPTYGEAYRRRAEVRERLGDLNGAVSDYEQAIRYLGMYPKQRSKVQDALARLKERMGT